MALRSTSVLRGLWGPPCRFNKATVSLYGTGRVTVDRRILPAVYEFNRCLVRHRYPSIYAQTGAFVCRQITDGVGYSLHAYGTAIDLNWLLNGRGYHATYNLPHALVGDILAIRTNSGAQVWGWGGNYTSAPPDYMHFEIVASPAEIAGGIRRGATPVPTGDEEPFTVAQYDDIMAQLKAVNLRLEGIHEELQEAKDKWWTNAARRTRLLLDHFNIRDE